MRKLTFPFRLPLREIKKDNAFRKTIQNKVIKTTMIGFMRQSCMFFFIMLIMYTSLAYLAIITVSLLEPVIGLIFFLAFLFIFCFVFIIYCCFFFFIMLIMYTFLSYLAIITVSLLEPVIGLIVFLAFLFMLWVFVTIFKNIFPKSKKNFLEYNNVYEKYLEVTKDIE